MQQTGPEIRGLAVLFPEEISVEINKWRRVYAPRYQMVPPHITVAYPPFVPEKEWPLVRPAHASPSPPDHPTSLGSA